MRRADFIVLALMLAGLAVLLSLGTWQMQRLAWKEGLIATVAARMKGDALPVADALAAAASEGGIDYRPVRIAGAYVPAEPVFEFTTHEGRSGWHVFNVLAAAEPVEGVTHILVNRGFIPYEERANWQSVAALPEGAVELDGLLRAAIAEKPGYFMPENEPQKRTFYWRDVALMSELAGNKGEAASGWYIDEGIPGANANRSALPVKGTTIVSFPNNHLQYAVTWYGLALALLGVGSFFLYSRARSRRHAV